MIITEQQEELKELQIIIKEQEDKISEEKQWYNNKFFYLSIGLVFGVVI